MKKNILILIFILIINNLSANETVFDRVLSKALWNADIKKASMAISRGADVDKIEYHNINKMPYESIKILLDNGYNLNDKQQGCILEKVMTKRDENDNFYKTISYMVAKGADTNCVDTTSTSITLLYHISRRVYKKQKYINNKAYQQAYKLILNKNNQVNKPSFLMSGTWGNKRSKATSMHAAIISGKSEIFKSLINAGADVNQVSHIELRDFGNFPARTSYTPLTGAIYMNNIELVKLVLQKGAKKNQKIKDGASSRYYSAIDYAHNKGYDDIEMYLLENGAKYISHYKLEPINNSNIKKYTNKELNQLLWKMHEKKNYKKNYKIILHEFEKRNPDISSWDTIAWIYKDRKKP